MKTGFYPSFVCAFNSWYHYLGFLSYLKENEVYADSIIVFTGGVLDKKVEVDISALDSHATNVFSVASLDEIEGLLSKNQERVSMVSASKYPYRLHKALQKRGVKADLLVIEEGIGTYGSYFSKVIALFRVAKASGKENSLPRFFWSLLISEIKKLSFIGVKRIEWLNYKRNVSSVNHNVVAGYKKALSSICEGENVPSLPQGDISLFISSPFFELGLVKKNDQVAFLKEFIKENGGMYVKPHPVEDFDKYRDLGVGVIDSTFPVEKLAYYMTEKSKVFSYSSTSLYTLRLFFGLTVTRVSDYDMFYYKLSSKQKKIIDNKV